MAGLHFAEINAAGEGVAIIILAIPSGGVGAGNRKTIDQRAHLRAQLIVNVNGDIVRYRERVGEAGAWVERIRIVLRESKSVGFDGGAGGNRRVCLWLNTKGERHPR